MFSPQQNQRRGQNRCCLETGDWVMGSREEVTQTMYIHVSTYKNDNIERKI
jgi:hypothetical protein